MAQPYFFKEKLEARLEEIASSIYRYQVPVTRFKVLPGKAPGMEAPVLDDSGWQDYDLETPWGGYREYQWFRTCLVIPREFEGYKVAFCLHSPYDDVWSAGAEYTAYLDGELDQGLDFYHKEMLLAKSAKAGGRFSLALLGFSGLSGLKTYSQAKLVAIDGRAEDYYFSLLTVWQLVQVLDPGSPDYHRLVQAANASVNLVDFRRPLSEDYYASLVAANGSLERDVYGKAPFASPITMHVTGHTHIDVAWLWQLSHTREKAQRSFATVLKLMEHYPGYTFFQSQPQLYQFVKEDNPALYAKIKERIAQGRWEADGGMWVEADCNLVSGESMVRQFLVGKRFMQDEFGLDNEILWLPDVFGYSAAMPQILRKSGIRYFMTTKISWNQFNDLPVDTFWLEGIDGSRVLSHFMTTPDLEAVDRHKLMKFRKTYNGVLDPQTVSGNWAGYKQKDLNTELILAYGYGDGGGGPTKGMLEAGKRMANLPGLPKVRNSSPRKFFHELERQIGQRDDIPVWVGELYLEMHRGTYTSMAKNKRYNRKSEYLYLNTELFSLLSSLHGGAYPRQALDEGWRLVLLNQFHDIIPGSSIKAVYEDSWKQYEALESSAKGLLADALGNLARQMECPHDGVLVMNPNSNVGEALVVAQGPAPLSVKTPKGECLPVQPLDGDRYAFVAKELPAKGWTQYAACHEAAAAPIMTAAPGLLENRFFRLELDGTGALASIYDKLSGRQVLEQGRRGNEIQAFEDKPVEYNCWDIEIYYPEKMWVVDDVQSVEVLENGPVSASLRIVRHFLDSVVTQDIVLYNGIPRIDFRTHIDWKQQEILLKVAFPVAVRAPRATYEIQYGAVERPTHENTSWEKAKFEVCAHKWIDLSEGDYGVSLLNDCKFGHDVHGNVMRLTLLKSGIYPNPDADKGEHTFTYSLYPHAGSWQEANVVAAAYALNNPCYTLPVQAQRGSLAPAFSAVSVDSPSLVVEAVKKAERSEDVIVRLYECHNTRGHATITFGFGFKEAFLCDLMEQNDVPLAADGNRVEIPYHNYEIITLKLRC